MPVHGDEEKIPADQRGRRAAVGRGTNIRHRCALNIIVLLFQASEEAIVKLRNSAAIATDHLQQPHHHHHHHQIYYVVNQILYPVVQGCETKEPKIVKVRTYLYDGDSVRFNTIA